MARNIRVGGLIRFVPSQLRDWTFSQGPGQELRDMASVYKKGDRWWLRFKGGRRPLAGRSREGPATKPAGAPRKRSNEERLALQQREGTSPSDEQPPPHLRWKLMDLWHERYGLAGWRSQFHAEVRRWERLPFALLESQSALVRPLRGRRGRAWSRPFAGAALPAGRPAPLKRSHPAIALLVDRWPLSQLLPWSLANVSQSAQAAKARKRMRPGRRGMCGNLVCARRGGRRSQERGKGTFRKAAASLHVPGGGVPDGLLCCFHSLPRKRTSQPLIWSITRMHQF